MDSAGSRCPHCGAGQSPHGIKRLIMAFALAIAIFWLLGFLGVISLPEEKE
jgi:hypothetical protein